METALKALAEPRRLEIVRLVATTERSAGEIASHFDITRPAVSQHLTVLKRTGLISERRAGTRRLYRARRDALEELRSYLDSLWGDALSSLKVAAEREERGSW